MTDGTGKKAGVANLPPSYDSVAWTIQQAAMFSGLSMTWLYEMCHNGVLPNFRVHGRILIPRSALMNWLEERSREAAEAATEKRRVASQQAQARQSQAQE